MNLNLYYLSPLQRTIYPGLGFRVTWKELAPVLLRERKTEAETERNRDIEGGRERESERERELAPVLLKERERERERERGREKEREREREDIARARERKSAHRSSCITPLPITTMPSGSLDPSTPVLGVRVEG